MIITIVNDTSVLTTTAAPFQPCALQNRWQRGHTVASSPAVILIRVV